MAISSTLPLQVLLVLDEADVFMPATSKLATKEPLLDLLRRARSGGMGIMIGTQGPGDLDYKGRDNITTSALGRIQDNTALEKIKFAGEGTAFDIRTLLPRFSAGRFLLRTEGAVSEVQANRALVETSQVPEERVLELATATRQDDASIAAASAAGTGDGLGTSHADSSNRILGRAWSREAR